MCWYNIYEERDKNRGLWSILCFELSNKHSPKNCHQNINQERTSAGNMKLKHAYFPDCPDNTHGWLWADLIIPFIKGESIW